MSRGKALAPGQLDALDVLQCKSTDAAGLQEKWDVSEPLKCCVWAFPAEGDYWDGWMWDFWDNLCRAHSHPQLTVFGFLKKIN